MFTYLMENQQIIPMLEENNLDSNYEDKVNSEIEHYTVTYERIGKKQETTYTTCISQINDMEENISPNTT